MIDGTSPHHSCHSSGATLKPRQNTIITHKNRPTPVGSSKKIGQAIAPKGPPNTCGEGRIKVGVSGFRCVFWPFHSFIAIFPAKQTKLIFNASLSAFAPSSPPLLSACLCWLLETSALQPSFSLSSCSQHRPSDWSVLLTSNALPRCSLRLGTHCRRRTAPARPPRRPSTQTRVTCCAKARCCWSHRLFPRCWDERSLAAFPTNGSRPPALPSNALA